MKYDNDVIPFPDESFKWFERALIQSSPLAPASVRRILRQCWRDIHNSSVMSDLTAAKEK